MRDFTLSSYNYLLDKLAERNYSFQTFFDFIASPGNRSVILRHDVDARNRNSLIFATIQHKRNIKGSYYFRMVPKSYDEGVIREIHDMGHEIGYHYETIDSCHGDIDKAYDEFRKNLDTLRKLVPITTICMHGSPRSPYDNRAIWNKYNYKELGIIGEPYFDIDFGRVAYLTDTGRRWNGSGVSVRDKVESPFKFNFRSTNDIIQNISQLPDQVMFTFHPQRWTNNPVLWVRELVMQNIKNQVKHYLIHK